VADQNNNRIQVFSPEGKVLKSIPIERPNLICVHQKSGALYVHHMGREKGKSVGRLVKLASFEDPRVACRMDGIEERCLIALDSWSAKPRIWVGGGVRERVGYAQTPVARHTVRVFEEQGKSFRMVRDLYDEVRKAAGGAYVADWDGIGSVGTSKAVCDPNRERLYYSCPTRHIFDLKTGEYKGRCDLPADDIAFDKKGFLHGHRNPAGGGTACLWRMDMSRPTETKRPDGRLWSYKECPYDYGVEVKGTGIRRWRGVVPLVDQPGAKGFQDGLGVNMRGRLAVESNIYYVPKMEEEGRDLGLAGWSADRARGMITEAGNHYSSFMRRVKEAQKKGERVYFIRRRPGIPLVGATVWMFDSTGECMSDTPAIPGDLVAGLQIDENDRVYFAMRRTRFVGGKRFLEGRAGTFGGKGGQTPFTCTYVRTGTDTFRLYEKRGLIPLDQSPDRPLDVTGRGGGAWVEGADWLYAGESPIVTGGCSCPSSRFHVDWYKRSYVPEAYRHSIGILDTNGNLIMHLGRYANFDGAPGGKDGCGPGETDIGVTTPRYIGGTDNYLAFEDWGERMLVLKLEYHERETVEIRR
jgi:hypothetical protein